MRCPYRLVQEMIQQHVSKDGKAGPQKAVALSQHDSEEAKLEKVLASTDIVSQREVQLPPTPALAAFISQALLAFEQWVGWLGQADPRPATAAKEVRGYSYVVQPDQSVALEFSVLRTRPPWREGPAPTTGTAAFFREQFGRVYDAAALAPLLPAPQASASPSEPLVLEPYEEVAKIFANSSRKAVLPRAWSAMASPGWAA